MSGKRPLSPHQAQISKRRSVSGDLCVNDTFDSDLLDPDLDGFLSQIEAPTNVTTSNLVSTTTSHTAASRTAPQAGCSRNVEEVDRIQGELIMVREEKERLRKALQIVESEMSNKIREKEMEIETLRESHEKEKARYTASETFKDRDLKNMQMKQKQLQQNLEKRNTETLTMLMNRLLDLSPDDGFVDWDSSISLTLDDFENDVGCTLDP